MVMVGWTLESLVRVRVEEGSEAEESAAVAAGRLAVSAPLILRITVDSSHTCSRQWLLLISDLNPSAAIGDEGRRGREGKKRKKLEGWTLIPCFLSHSYLASVCRHSHSCMVQLPAGMRVHVRRQQLRIVPLLLPLPVHSLHPIHYGASVFSSAAVLPQ